MGRGLTQNPLVAIDNWGAAHAAAAVVGPDAVVATHGDVEHRFRIASITKLFTAVAALVAVEEETLDLDEPAGPPGSTVRHLLAHASGLNFDDDAVLAEPGTRRIYSNTGFELLGDLLAKRSAMPIGNYLAQAALEPLGLSDTRLEGSVAKDLWSTLTDTVTFARELLRPTLLAAVTLAGATDVVFSGLPGVLPGVGRYEPLAWGLGFDLPGHRDVSYAGTCASKRTFGHFGGSGTLCWVDPGRDLACVVLTDREFDAWALEAWPLFSDAVLAHFARD